MIETHRLKNVVFFSKQLYSCLFKSSVVVKWKRGKYWLKVDMGEKSFLPKKLPLIGSKAKKLKDNLYYGNGVSKVFFWLCHENLCWLWLVFTEKNYY